MKRGAAILLVLLAGCAPEPRPSTAAIFVRSVLQAAARQAQRCYRFPRVGHEGRQIATRLRVRIAEDGSLSGLPEVVEQLGVTPTNRAYAQPMATAAVNAVVGCAPYRLPPEVYYQGAVEVDLLFAPLARA